MGKEKMGLIRCVPYKPHFLFIGNRPFYYMQQVYGPYTLYQIYTLSIPASLEEEGLGMSSTSA